MLERFSAKAQPIKQGGDDGQRTESLLQLASIVCVEPCRALIDKHAKVTEQSV